MELLGIRNARILTMETPEVTVGDIRLEGGRIAAIGPEAAAGLPACSVLEAQGKLAMPGLVNCHNHAAMTLFRGYCCDLRLMEWLARLVPIEDRATGDDVYWGTLLACAEMIRSGTTTFADMYIHMEEAARAVADSGMRGVLTRGMVFLSGDGGRLAEARHLYDRWHGGAGGRVRVLVGPHAPYTCPPPYLRQAIALADELGTGIHIHLSETAEEQAQIFREYGKSPARYLYDNGMFDGGRPVLLAHCVHLSRDDLYLLRGAPVAVSHNPVSNLSLACGLAPVREMRELGYTVGLGTDGAGSATSLDMFAEVKLAAWLAKNAAGDPGALDAWTVLRMATLEGARALGLEQELGTLAPGKRADVILLDLEQPHLYPRHDLVALLAYAATGADVDSVIVDGRLIMQGRRLLAFDVAGTMAQAHRRAIDLVNRA